MTRSPSPSASIDCTVPIPSTCPWTMWPPIGVTGAQRRLEVDLRAAAELAERRSAERLGNGVEGQAAVVTASAVRQTPLIATEPPTSTSGAVPRRLDLEPHPLGAARDGGDDADLANDPGEHAERLRGWLRRARALGLVDVRLEEDVVPDRPRREVEQRRSARRARRGSAGRRPRASARRTRAACRRGPPRGTPSRASARPRGEATARLPSPSAASSSCEAARAQLELRLRRAAARGRTRAVSVAARPGRHARRAEEHPRDTVPIPTRDRVRGGAQLVHEPPRRLARHPARPGTVTLPSSVVATL